MNHATVGGGELSLETGASQGGEAAGKMRRVLVPLPRGDARDCFCTERIVPKPKLRSRRKERAASRQHGVDHRHGRRREVDFNADAGIEVDALERSFERRLRCGQAEAVIAARTGKHQRQAGRTVAEFPQRNLVGDCRIGMVDP